MKIIQISKHIELVDPVLGQIRNRLTGHVFEVSQETLSLLSVFVDPVEVGDELEGLSKIIESEDDSMIREFVKDLLDQEVLVGLDDDIHGKISNVDLSNIALVEKPPLSCLGVPVCDIDSEYSYDLAIIGMPFDLGTTGYPGARFGPLRVRELSSYGTDYRAKFSNLACEGWLTEHGHKLCDDLRIVDLGDVIHQVGESFSGFFDRLNNVVSSVVDRGAIPISIGGDHSCSYATICGSVKHHQDVHLVIFDAHTDLADYDRNISHNHGNFLSRLIGEKVVSKITHVGLRGMVGKPFVKDGYTSIYAGQCGDVHEILNQLPIKEDEKVYVSFDVDVIDPSFAPGTGTPVPCGLQPNVVSDCIREVVSRTAVVGLDIVEYNPMRDINDATGNLILHMLPQLLDAFPRNSA